MTTSRSSLNFPQLHQGVKGLPSHVAGALFRFESFALAVTRSTKLDAKVSRSLLAEARAIRGFVVARNDDLALELVADQCWLEHLGDNADTYKAAYLGHLGAIEKAIQWQPAFRK